jgi:hypothetical protein
VAAGFGFLGCHESPDGFNFLEGVLVAVTRRELFGALFAPLISRTILKALPVPAPVVESNPMLDELNAITLKCITPRIADLTFRQSPLIYLLTANTPVHTHSIGPITTPLIYGRTWRGETQCAVADEGMDFYDEA